MKALLLVVGIVSVAAATAGRTIVLDGTAVDRAAAIHEEAPRLSWAGQPSRPGCFQTASLFASPRASILFRFDLSAIPRGQRIVDAELSVPVIQGTGNNLRFYLWRLTADWGPGVCWEYRTTHSVTNGWSKAGARGPGTDRATRPSAVPSVTQPGDIIINVTEDVALWLGGGAPARGWLLTVEDPDAMVLVPSFLWADAPRWKLKVTHEPP